MSTRRLVTNWLGAIVAVLVAAAPAMAQQGNIAGLVRNNQGQPIAGAQVSVLSPTAVQEGTAAEFGTLTQGNGRFIIRQVPAGQWIVRVELIGYSTGTERIDVETGETAIVNFNLETEAISLERIVVTGVAGATQRAKVPFEVGQVNAADLPVPQVSAANAIQGKIAGAQVVSGSGRPGSAPSILLRGPTSLDASGRDQEPLYLVDGVILGSSMVDIDALDIESIEVVKGAAAASLYGSRAANGVVQITTKRGHGVPNNTVRYTARSEYGQSSLASTPDDLLTEVHQFQLTGDGSQFVDEAGNACDWLNCQSVALAGTDAWDTYQVHEWPGTTYNQVEEFFESSDFVQNYISAEGRSGATNFHVSVSNLQEGGVMPGQDGFNRTNFRVNVDQSVRPDLQVSGSAFYSLSTQDLFPESQGNPMFDLTRMPAGVNLRGTLPGQPDSLVLFVDPVNNESPNPLYTMLNREYQSDRSRFLGSGNVRWSPLTWLDIDANASYDRLDRDEQDFYPKGFRTLEEDATLNDGYLDRFAVRNEALNASLTASMNFAVTEDISNTTQLRYLYEDTDYESVFTGGSEFAVGGVTSLGNLNTERISSNQTIQEVRADGYFIITNFDLYDRYIIDALVRNDGSSLFGEDERRQWYYRVAGAWRMGQEDWFNLDAVDELKLRYSLGTAGGRPNFYAQYETYSVGGGRVTPVSLGNNDLKPEFSTEHEMGIDASFYQGRITAGLTYAMASTEDQILPVPLPAYTGFETQWRNAGTIESNTWEATLGAVLMRTEDMSWSVRVLFDRTRSEITELNVPAFQYGVPGQELGSVFYAREGEEVGTFYGYQFAENCGHLPDGVSCDGFEVNDDGYLVWVGDGGFAANAWGDESDVDIRGSSVMWGTPFAGECTDRVSGERVLSCPTGNSLPDYNWSFGSTFNWGGLSVYGLIDASQGFDVYNQPLQWGTFKRWTGIMDQTGVPEADRKPVGYYDALYGVSGLGPSSAFVEDGSFIKLRELSASYRFDADDLTGIPGLQRFTSVGLSLTGRNLVTWTDYRGFDPEVGKSGGDTGSSALARVEGYQYPNFRTWTAALEIVF